MHKLAELAVRRPVLATMLILAISVTGLFSLFTLGVDLLPEVDFPTVVVTVVNPGASPEAVETEITRRVEEAVNTISGLDELRSTSTEGFSRVIVTFNLDKDTDVAVQEVRDNLSLIQPDLPETAEVPVIRRIDPGATPVLRIAIAAPRPLREVTDIADNQIREQIESVPGVGQVQLLGGQLREIHIRVDPDRLRAYNLTVAEVAQAVSQQNVELPAGRVDAGAREFSVRALGRLPDPAEFDDLVVANRAGYAVRVRDIGYAADASEEPRSSSRLNGQPAVTLVVSKQSGTNTVEVAEGVKARLAELARVLPADVRTQVIADQSIFIEAAIDSIRTHLMEGALLASVVLYFFLANFRTTLIAAVSIPTSIVSTFAFMNAMGYTLNQITMLALTLMVGIVIDDSIIVLENIYRHMEEYGKPPFQAAIEGTREIGLAVMATTLSLLAVFIPVGFMGGIVGRFMSSFGLTASFAIAVSVLVSFTLAPMLTSRFVRPAAEHAGRRSKENRLYRKVDGGYMRLLAWSMAHRRVIVLASVLTVLSIVPLFTVIGKNFLPREDRSEFEITFRAPEGSSLAATSNIGEWIARQMHTLPGVLDTMTSVGGGEQETVNTGSVYVRLAPMKEREADQFELMARAREIVARFPVDLRASVQQAGAAPGGLRTAEVQYSITGPDLDQLADYSTRLVEPVKQIPDAVDVDTSLEPGTPELRVEIDRERAADLGVRVADIAQALNVLLAGQVVSTFETAEDQYDVRVRAVEEFRRSARALDRLVVASPAGPVTLDQVVSIEEGTGPSSIDRLNRERQFTVYANVVPGGSQAEVLAEIDRIVAEMNLRPGYSTALTGQSRELGRTGYYFGLAFLLSFIFMYMVLAGQFESFLHPVTILLTLPLAVPFGILSLLLFGQTVNVFSGLGLLLLFGIVKKNAILQIDRTNGLRAEGLPRNEAILRANRDRLRPILMTTIALVAGMMPLVFSSGAGSATNRSIGVLVAGGQTLCLLLTLLAVPVFYSLFDDLRSHPVWGRIGRRYGAMRDAAARRLAEAWAGLRGRRPQEGPVE